MTEMKKFIAVCAVTMLAVTGAWAAFVAPTAAQLNDAAENPAKVAALLKDASVQQAADIVRDVLSRVAALGLSGDQLSARVRDVVKAAFGAMSGDAGALAGALGALVRDNTTLQPLAGAISEGIRMAKDISIARIFDAKLPKNGIVPSLTSGNGAPKKPDTTPPPPPVATGYKAQTLP